MSVGARVSSVFLVAALAGCGGEMDVAFDVDAGDYVALGKQSVDQRKCATCHEDSASAGTLSGSMTPVAGTMTFGGNLTPDVATGIGGWADVAIVRAMRAGVDDTSRELCPSMTRYPAMSDVEARAIVAYLRSLLPVSRAVPQSVCIFPDMSAPGD